MRTPQNKRAAGMSDTRAAPLWARLGARWTLPAFGATVRRSLMSFRCERPCKRGSVSPQKGGRYSTDGAAGRSRCWWEWRWCRASGSTRRGSAGGWPGSAVLLRYRELFATTDRADIYIAFFDYGLRLLADDGVLAFICANRFTKNKYGESLRRLISERFRVRYYLNLEHTQLFLSDVSAYPAVFVIDMQVGEKTRARMLENLIAKILTSIRPRNRGYAKGWSVFERWHPTGTPSLFTDAGEQKRLASLAQRFATIEQSAIGTRIGIGVATGADTVLVLPEKHPDVADSLQIPLLLAADVRNDCLKWSGHYLLNPFAPEDDGSLAAFRDFLGLARYMRANERSGLGFLNS